MALEIGSVHWKAKLDEQKRILHHIDPGTRVIMGMKELFDLYKILNPGNWEM